MTKARGAVVRLGWGVADQGMSSISNFLIGAYVAKTLGAVALGIFALALVTYAVILNASRGLSTDPLMVRYSNVEERTWRPAVAASSGVALLAGIAGGVATVLVGLVLVGMAQPDLGSAFVVLGLGLPGLLLQDSWRYAFFSAGQGQKAFVNDAAWMALMVAGLVLVHIATDPSTEAVLVVFVVSAALASLLGMAQARTAPTLRTAKGWVVSNADLGPRYLAENVIMSLAGQVRSVVLAAAAGLAAVGQVRAAEMLFGPFLVVMRGLAQVAVPEGRRWVPRGQRAFHRFCLALGLGIAAVALGYGAVVALLLPVGVGELLLGDVWETAYPLVPGAVVIAMGSGGIVGASAGLRSLGRADLSLRAQVIASVLAMVGGGVGAAGWGAMGAVWGGAITTLAGAAVWWYLLRVATVEHFTLAERGAGPALDGAGSEGEPDTSTSQDQPVQGSYPR